MAFPPVLNRRNKARLTRPRVLVFESYTAGVPAVWGNVPMIKVPLLSELSCDVIAEASGPTYSGSRWIIKVQLFSSAVITAAE